MKSLDAVGHLVSSIGSQKNTYRNVNIEDTFLTVRIDYTWYLKKNVFVISKGIFFQYRSWTVSRIQLHDEQMADKKRNV